MSLNRIVIVGRLTRDPELKYTPNGIEVATMGVAVNRFTKNDEGEYETDFFNVVAWRRSAKFASDYLTKGRLVSIDGRLQARSWVDQATGQKRTAYEIVAENIQGLDRRPDGDNEEGHPDAEHDEGAGSYIDHSEAQPLPTSGGGVAVAFPPARAAAPKPAAPKGAAQSRPTPSTPAADNAAAARETRRQALLAEAARLADEGTIDESDPFADD